jgi:type IV pilus secretin PilQ/predicted competence protein
MNWRRGLGLCLLFLTASGCTAAGRASLPVESAPDAALAGDATTLAESGTATLSGSTPTRISEIRVAENSEDSGTVIVEIEATSSINYTSYEPEPNALVVEIPNVDLSALPSELIIGKAGIEVAEITAVPSHGGGSHARFEFRSLGELDAVITPRGNILQLELTSGKNSRFAWKDTPTITEKSATAVPAEAAVRAAGQNAERKLFQPEPISLDAIPLLPASMVQGVIVEDSSAGASIAVTGDGALKFSSFVLTKPDRLVVDIKGVSNGVAERQIDVGSMVLNRVRIAQFRTKPEKIVRVVFDLSNETDYEIRDEGETVRVFLGQAAQIARNETQMMKNTPEPVVASSSVPETPGQPVGDGDDVEEDAAGRIESAALQIAQAPEPTNETPTGVSESDLESSHTVAFQASNPETIDISNDQEKDSVPSVLIVEQQTPVPASSAVPELTPRLVPSSPLELDNQIVLFDRAEPEDEGSAEGGNQLIPAGATFQSRTIASSGRRYRGEKISVTFRDADILEVFFFFSEIMNMNVVPDPDVSGSVNIRLTQVPWDQAFSIILKNQGLDAVEEDRIVRIAKTDKLRREAAERRALKQAQEQEVDPITFTRQLSYARVEEALPILQQVTTSRGKIIADRRTNTLIITDIPDKRAEFENLLSALDTQTPQVSIEARIVEAIRSFERSMGITWGFTAQATPALGTQTNLSFPHSAAFDADVNLGSTSQAGTVGIALGNVLDSVTLDVTLDAFEADGKVRILSAPKVVTQNNTPAKIEQGVQIPVVTTTATEIEVQYVPASLVLEVTPQITAEQTVIMQIKVENNQPSSTISVGDTPGIVTEVVETQIMVRSGTTAVIGGVYKLQETDNELGIPGLRRIPFFGWLFKNKSFEKQSSELLVFLTPRIVTNV